MFKDPKDLMPKYKKNDIFFCICFKIPSFVLFMLCIFFFLLPVTAIRMQIAAAECYSREAQFYPQDGNNLYYK